MFLKSKGAVTKINVNTFIESIKTFIEISKIKNKKLRQNWKKLNILQNTFLMVFLTNWYSDCKNILIFIAVLYPLPEIKRWFGYKNTGLVLKIKKEVLKII